MKNLKFLPIIFFILILPISKADGCGLVCPHGHDLLTFSLSVLCNFFTWGFCHIFAFLVVAITSIGIYVFWIRQGDKKKKNIKIILFALFGIFVLFMLYPYIRTWVSTPPSTTIIDPCSTYDNDVCIINSPSTSGSHTQYSIINYWKFHCDNANPDTATVGTNLGIITPVTHADIDSTIPWFYSNVTGLTDQGGNIYIVTLECPAG